MVLGEIGRVSRATMKPDKYQEAGGRKSRATAPKVVREPQ